MYQDLVQINDNYGAIIDEDGNISIISKETQEYELADILKKENDLEKLELNLEENKKTLSDLKSKIFFGKIISILTIVDEFILYCVLHSVYSSTVVFSIMAIFYLLVKIPATIEYGTKIEGIIKKKKLQNVIKELEDKRFKSEKELQKMKVATNYQIYRENEIDCPDNGMLYQYTNKYMNRNVEDVPTDVKVLRLTEENR